MDKNTLLINSRLTFILEEVVYLFLSRESTLDFFELHFAILTSYIVGLKLRKIKRK